MFAWRDEPYYEGFKIPYRSYAKRISLIPSESHIIIEAKLMIMRPR